MGGNAIPLSERLAEIGGQLQKLRWEALDIGQEQMAQDIAHAIDAIAWAAGIYTPYTNIVERPNITPSAGGQIPEILPVTPKAAAGFLAPAHSGAMITDWQMKHDQSPLLSISGLLNLDTRMFSSFFLERMSVLAVCRDSFSASCFEVILSLTEASCIAPWPFIPSRPDARGGMGVGRDLYPPLAIMPSSNGIRILLFAIDYQ